MYIDRRIVVNDLSFKLQRHDFEEFSLAIAGTLYSQPPKYLGNIELASEASIKSFGLLFNQWQIHFWINKLPIKELSWRKFVNENLDFDCLILDKNPSLSKKSKFSKIAINFQTPNKENYEEWIFKLSQQEIIWDPNPIRAEFLHRIGLPVYWIDPNNFSNGWLNQKSIIDSDYFGRKLGLPIPFVDHVLVLGHVGLQWDRSLASETNQGINRKGIDISYLPGWEEIILETKLDYFAQACWLDFAISRSKIIIMLNQEVIHNQYFLDLFETQPMFFNTPFTPDELRANLKGEELLVDTEERFTSAYEDVFNWQSNNITEVSVCISLYNYDSRIIQALDSVDSQTQKNIELIVVDDASTDNGLALVKDWMHKQALDDNKNFARLSLLKHSKNQGLAAARNTAFGSATAEWCFLLDADNALFPEALQKCKQLAALGSKQLAVVHPLILVESEAGREDDQRSLVGLAPWQKSRLKYENTIDAMALIRRSAWKAVGGFTHIEDGWEDYDFWCKLIDHGFYGVQCPQILAVYRSHQESMSYLFTNINWRSLARTLLNRHPWMTPRSLN